MTSVYLAPDLVHTFTDANGNPLSGGLLYTYAAGTSTPQTTYTDSTGTTANANPVVLDTYGQCSLWLDATLQYKFVLKDSGGTLIKTIDNAPGASLPASSSVGGRKAVFTASGSFTVPSSGVTQIYVSAVAGGGGGGGGAGNQAIANYAGGGGGGGAGQSVQRQAYNVSANQVITISIGAGGSGGPGGAAGANDGTDGSQGGNTTVGSLVTLTGGYGGTGGKNAANGVGFAGGQGGQGWPYGSAGNDGAAFCAGGMGASSPFGGGGGADRGYISGTGFGGKSGGGYGGGGGGGGGCYGSSGSVAGSAGGAGTSGYVVIEY